MLEKLFDQHPENIRYFLMDFQNLPQGEALDAMLSKEYKLILC